MSKREKIVVAGGGAFGTALASVLSKDQGLDVTLLMRDADNAKQSQEARENVKRLPGIGLPDALLVTSEISVISEADILLSVVPSKAQIAFAKDAVQLLSPSCAYVCCAKGFDNDTGNLFSNELKKILGANNIAVLSGPGFATDIANGLPTAMTLAADKLDMAEMLAQQLSQKTFRLYASQDVVGVQTGGSLKNVLAIAAGIVMGANLGESARASIIARGLAELSRFIIFRGGQPETASGLSGLGDLVLTATSTQSRNYQFGMKLGAGAKPSELLGPDKPLVEGATAAVLTSNIARENNIALPITNSVADILNGQLDVKSAIEELLARPLRLEKE